MYLKALEVQGFKSFPDKTVLNFGEDITAIVGPNGSGKSNISDAIRWVMGEQSSKALRGGKMEDVIFGGTEKRAPVGFAQVTLVLDNTGHLFPSMDESEVAVTRRYYRSGESEYYINRQSVRLKDMTELFMDTGMGREGYSIVGQGRVDEILSTKSTDRREIFEEAAGISKYRHRKEEAERKLEELARTTELSPEPETPEIPENPEEGAPEAESPEGENSQTAMVMTQVRRYLEDNYMFDLSLDSVGEILHISPAYLSAQFKKYQKMNFLDCLTELRINAAKELLADPFRSSAEVASMVGYEDASYFARAFKKRTGMTPTQYRRQAGKKSAEAHL